MWEKEEVGPSTIILRQGQIPEKVYLLVSGNVHLSYNWRHKKPNSSRYLMQRNSKKPKNQVFAILGKGEMVGDECAFDLSLKTHSDKLQSASKNGDDKFLEKVDYMGLNYRKAMNYNQIGYDVVSQSRAVFFSCDRKKFMATCMIDEIVHQFMINKIKFKKYHFRKLMSPLLNKIKKMDVEYFNFKRNKSHVNEDPGNHLKLDFD